MKFQKIALGIFLLIPFLSLFGDSFNSSFRQNQTPQFSHHYPYKVVPDFRLGPPEYPIFEARGRPITLSNSVWVYDRNVPYFDNAVLTISLKRNATKDDQLLILQDYDVHVFQKEISLNGIVVGNFQGGKKMEPLVITFNRFADIDSVQKVMQHIGFYNAAPDPSLGDRVVSFVLTNGSGGVSREVTKTILIQARPKP